MRACEDIFIERDALSVYTFLADGTKNPLWHPTISSTELKFGANGQVGALYQQTFDASVRRPFAQSYIITKARPGVELEFNATTGRMKILGGYYFSSHGSGTVVRYQLETAPVGLSRMFSRDPAPILGNEVRHLNFLKYFLEAELAA